ncbi:MAG: DUF4390 domain-containing protein [Gammaproteobacteria bacterium]|nr:DUF4390 domain-containing protein [Gammaproteobacteria bacterium]
MIVHVKVLRALAICLVSVRLAAGADDVTIQRISGNVVDGFYYVDARILINLSADARGAVESGVPLTFAYDFVIVHERRFLWDENVLLLRRTFNLVRHALADSYIVTDTVADSHVVSPSLDEALEVLGTLSRIAIGKTSDFGPARALVGRARAQLDIESLPAPLRPIAYVSPSWRLKSTWHAWELLR